MATGEVIVTGTQIAHSASGYGGDPQYAPGKAYDENTATFWNGPDPPTGAYIGWDLGVGVTRTPTAIRIAPRPSANDGAVYEQFVWNSTVAASNTSATTGLVTLKTIPSYDDFPRRDHFKEYALTGSTAYRWLRFGNDTYGQIAEFQFIVSATSGAGTASSKPLEPVITPGGGRYNNSIARTVTMTCRTTSATIMYTTDGTTPAHTAGTPTGTTQIYTGPIAIAPTAAGKTIKAIAYDASCSTTTSMVATSAPFIIQNMPKNDRWYQVGDLTGFSPSPRTVEAHAPCIVPPSKSGDGYYYMFGHFSDVTNTGNNPGCLAIWCYRSTDCVNWTLVNQAVDGETYGIGVGAFIVRPHVVYRPSTGKWVLWCKMGASTSYAAMWTANSLTGPWTLDGLDRAPLNSPQAYDGFSDFSFFEDTDGVVYVFASVTIGVTFYLAIQRMAANGLGCTGTGFEFGQSNREAPVMVKYGSNYFAITSVTNYYDPSSTFDVRYICGTGGSTPLNVAAWDALPGTYLFGADMTGTDFNSQPSDSVVLPGIGLVLLMDYWHQTNNFLSNQVWVPLSFPTATTLVGSQTGWYPAAAVSGSGGGALGTDQIARRSFSRRNQLTRHARR